MRKLSEIAHELEASMIDEGNRTGWAYYATHPLAAKPDRGSNPHRFAQEQVFRNVSVREQPEFQINADRTSD